MKMVVDLQGAQTTGSRFRGIGRYSLSLAKAMARQSKGHELYVVINHAFPETVDGIRQAFSGLLERDHILVFESLQPVAEFAQSNRWRARTAELIREYFLQGLAPDIVHVSSLFEGYLDDAVTSIGHFCEDLPTAVTLYDLIPYLNQDQYLPSPLAREWYMRKLASLKKADLLLAISESTRQEALEALGFPEERIVNISADAAPVFRVINATSSEYQAVRQRYGLKQEIIMYVGGFDPRKNVEALISAFAKISTDVRSRHQLLIVGNASGYELRRLRRYCKKLKLKANQVVFAEYVGDEDLVLLYNSCKLFVFPSLHEGFGLPVLEAMRCGAPVIGSERSSIPEVIGLKEALFDPDSIESIADKIQQALTDGEFRQRLYENGRTQAKKFSWEVGAKRTLEAFEALYESKRYEGGTRSRAQCPVDLDHLETDPQFQEGFDESIDTHVLEQRRHLIAAIRSIDGCAFSKSDLMQAALSISENEPAFSVRQLLVDITISARIDYKTGVQRVVHSVISSLLDNQPKQFYIKPVSRKAGLYRYARQFVPQYQGHAHGGMEDDLVEVKNHDIFLGLDLDPELLGDIAAQAFLQHHHQRGMKIYFVLYDLLPVLKPEYFSRQVSGLFEGWLNKITVIADGIVCISRSVADELKTWLDQRQPERTKPLHIGFFHLGADLSKNPMTRGITEEGWELVLELKQKAAFLMVGTVEPRKGHSQVLDALERLWIKGEDVLLIIVGKQGWKVEKLTERLHRHPENGKRLFWVKNASDELLQKFYEHSSALLMASEGEGFGLPLIEAARYGLPIIARDLPVFCEVAGEHAYYFTSNTGEELAGSLATWLAMYRSDRHPKSEGLKWMNWEQSSQQLIDVLLKGNWYKKWQ